MALEAGGLSDLRYEVSHDASFVSKAARIIGIVGDRHIDLQISNSAEAGWICNGCRLPELAGAEDVDLGFSPATNTSAIRRLGLRTGESCDLVAAWLDTSDWTFKPLAQRYRRKSAAIYEYVSVHSGYQCDLHVDQLGLITLYPDLWTAVGFNRAQLNK